MNKEQEVKKAESILLDKCYGDLVSGNVNAIAEKLYDNGYRSEEEVRKITAKQIFDIVAKKFCVVHGGNAEELLAQIMCIIRINYDV